MREYDHNEPVDCDYRLHEKCWKTLPPHKGIPHPVMMWDKEKQEMVNVLQWCCIECEMGFDED